MPTVVMIASDEESITVVTARPVPTEASRLRVKRSSTRRRRSCAARRRPTVIS
jgi:hypothetical protein